MLTKEIDICYELKGQTNFVSYEDHMIIPRQGEFGFDVFIRMELLTPLTDYISRNGITVGGITKLCEDMCTALAVLEQKRIIHRDIKPANIFINAAGDYKLGDFGVARHMEGLGSMSVKGTYNYMAPEILKGGMIGPNSDLYSLGLVLYRLLNFNRAPFLPPPPAQVGYQDDQDALEQRLSGLQLPLPARADLSVPLTNVIMRACEYETTRRFQTATDMKRMLRDFLDTERRSSHGYYTGGVDPDATVAVDPIMVSGVIRSPSGSFPASPLGSNRTPGYPSAPKPYMHNRSAIIVLLSIMGMVIVVLLVILGNFFLRSRDGLSTPSVITETLLPTTATSIPETPRLAPTPIPSTLKISDYTLPDYHHLSGEIHGVRGIITSNYRILEVTVYVYNADGVVETGITVYPYDYSYDIRNADYDILFDILSVGTHTYEVAATDEYETKVLFSYTFEVYTRR